MQQRGQLIVVAAPSGAGKTSLMAAVVNAMPRVCVSVSSTTRQPRPNEVEGEHYCFLTDAAFEKQIADARFLEYASVHGAYYGTSRDWVEQALDSGKDVVLEIDWQGALQVRTHFEDAVLIFIFPPSLDCLAERLRARAQDSEAVIMRRLAVAQEEMAHYVHFDYLVINDDFKQAQDEIMMIIRTARLRVLQQVSAHEGTVRALVGDAG